MNKRIIEMIFQIENLKGLSQVVFFTAGADMFQEERSSLDWKINTIAEGSVAT